jgi:bacillithiol system protein YtxJ
MQPLSSTQEFDAVLQEPTAVVFKHSTRCPISAAAMEQMRQLDGRHADAPIYVVDVNDRRDVSDYIAERLGTPHDSPQAFVLDHGAPVWRASHYSIRADDVAQALEGRG